MTFYDNKHKDNIKQIEDLWNGLTALSELGKSFGIPDIFQDNGAKVLQQLIYLNMTFLPGRGGNDCVSASGVEWEMKSINLETTASGFSTSHHLTQEILEKYRQVPWSFAIYNGLDLIAMYVVQSNELTEFYDKWEKQLQDRTHLNNPKIPIKFVKEHGTQVYPINPNKPIDPDSITKND